MNGDSGKTEKGGFKQYEGKEVDVSDVLAKRLAEIQAEVGKDGIDLNVDVSTGRAKPDIVIVETDKAKPPKEKPL